MHHLVQVRRAPLMYGWKMQPREICIIICVLSDVLLNPDVWTMDMDHLKRAYLLIGFDILLVRNAEAWFEIWWKWICDLNKTEWGKILHYLI